MPDITKLNAAIDAYAEQSHGSMTDGGELSRQRGIALERYAGVNLDPAPEGRSQVVDRTVFETTQWIMPSMMRIFAGAEDNIVEFEAMGPDDEEVAEQESDYLNYLVTQRNDWDLTVRTWIQDALITKNAYCMAFMEEKLVPEIERYEGQSEDQVALLLEDDVEVVGHTARDNPDAEPQLVDPATDQLIDPQDEATLLGAQAIYAANGLEPVFGREQIYDIELKRVKPQKRLRFRVLPPERVKVGSDTPDFTLEETNYFEYWDEVTISDLRKLGFDVDDDIGDDRSSDTVEDAARDTYLELDSEHDSPDPSMRQVIARTIWIRFDYDEDGIAELQRVVRVGTEILDREPASRIPVACIVPFINTHRHMGNSIADLTADIQRIKTSLTRNMLDALSLSVNPRHAVSDRVNLDDMLVSRAGGIVRLRQGAIPGEGHVMPLVTENTAPIAQAGLQYLDTVIEARVGVNRMFQGIDESNINDHNRIGQLSTMAAQRVEDIARLFGSGFKRLFSIAHELLIKSGHSEEVIKLRGQWVTIDPTQWRTGRDMRVVAPFAAGNKDALLNRMMMIAGLQEKALAGGLPITDADDAYRLALDIAKAADLNGERYWTDPATIPPQEPAPDHTMIALEIENKKAENQAADTQIDAEVDKYKTDVAAEIDKYRADLQAQTQLALAQIKAGQQIDLERFKNNLTNAPIELDAKSEALGELNNQITESITQITKALAELQAATTAPIKVVRENGKIIGKEVNGNFIPLEDTGR